MSSTSGSKLKTIGIGIVKVCLILLLLYLFICSLDLLSASFRLIAGKAAGTIFSNAEALENPIVGLMIGILGTVTVQSSSTFTSILISMTAGGILEVHMAVPMVMGANIGTSVTNTIVSLTQIGDREDFRRAFAGATIHDMFNWCSVVLLLIVEVISGYLEFVSGKIVDAVIDSGGGTKSDIVILKALTKPLTDKIVKIDKKVLKKWAAQKCDDCRLMKVWCGPKNRSDILHSLNITNAEYANHTELEVFDEKYKCDFLFNKVGYISDLVVGLILLVLSLVVLCVSLLLMVKILNSLLQGAMANVVKKVLNPKLPHEQCQFLVGYFNILVGAVMTFIVQSSSVFTSTMTPLVGIGLIEVETVYPLFLGSNIGTTTTGLLAALASDGNVALRNALQLALVHLIFNVTGILIFYPIPFMRWPIPMCKFLGNTCAKYRWFAFLYLILSFVIVPGFVLAISLNKIVFWVFFSPIVLLIVLIALINIGHSYPTLHEKMPKIIQTWEFLPLPMRSLEPYDRIITGWTCCKRFRHEEPGEVMDVAKNSKGGFDNANFVNESDAEAKGNMSSKL